MNETMFEQKLKALLLEYYKETGRMITSTYLDWVKTLGNRTNTILRIDTTIEYEG